MIDHLFLLVEKIGIRFFIYYVRIVKYQLIGLEQSVNNKHHFLYYKTLKYLIEKKGCDCYE